MILTYKVKHHRDFKEELSKAFQVAQFALNSEEQKITSKHVSYIGLPSAISNQIIRKYGRNKKLKVVKSVKLTVPSQGIRFQDGQIYISCLKLTLNFHKHIKKINQIELGDQYAYISCTVECDSEILSKTHMGVDRNTTGNIATVAIKETGKVYKFGKQALHIRKKYKQIRTRMQKKKQFKQIKAMKNKESRIVKDINHKVSRSIVNLAVKNSSEIRLEDLRGIRKAKSHKSFKGTLNSWSFYQLGEFIEYKASLAGIKIFKINPAYTSKACSKCGAIGDRKGKNFKCSSCGHVEHADVNASFNIAMPSKALVQLQGERDLCKRRTGEPQGATL